MNTDSAGALEGSIQRCGNAVLQALDPERRRELCRYGRETKLPAGKILYLMNEEIRTMCFVNAGLVSFVGSVGNDCSVGVALGGSETVVGSIAVLDRDSMPFGAVVLSDSQAVQVPVERVLLCFRNDPDMHGAMLRQLSLLLTQVTLSAVCNARHTVEQRLSRWLLMGSDCSGGNDLRVTQHEWAIMLGVARSTVNLSVAKLKSQGAILHRRGILQVADRAVLLTFACDCYRSFRDEYARISKRSR